MKIRDFILSLVSWFILLVTVSCSDELGGERTPISSESNLHVLVPTVLSSRGTNPDDASGLPTYNATVDECQINDLTLYAFPTGNEGKLLKKTLPAPLASMMLEQHVANYQLNIEPGTYHIYVVANMNKVLSGKTIQTENDLKKIVLDYRPTSTPGMPVCTNIPMIYEPEKDATGKLAETEIKAAGDKYTEVAANLKFTCVKVKLNLIFDPNDAEVATNFGGKPFSITVFQPISSLLLPIFTGAVNSRLLLGQIKITRMVFQAIRIRHLKVQPYTIPNGQTTDLRQQQITMMILKEPEMRRMLQIMLRRNGFSSRRIIFLSDISHQNPTAVILPSMVR